MSLLCPPDTSLVIKESYQMYMLLPKDAQRYITDSGKSSAWIDLMYNDEGGLNCSPETLGATLANCLITYHWCPYDHALTLGCEFTAKLVRLYG